MACSNRDLCARRDLRSVVVMQCADLVRGIGFRGAPVAFSSAVSMRLGRAIGTWLRRQGHNARHVVVARSANGIEVDVRDGLVSGLVLAGLSVVDVGCVGPQRFAAALRVPMWPIVGGLSLSSSEDAITLTLVDGQRPVSGAALTDIAAIADRGVFGAAEPAGVVVVDTTVLPWPVEDDISTADHTLADE